jgi:FxsC-like protein
VSQVSPAEQGSAPYFFLSYAHTPAHNHDRTDPDKWVLQLYKDLCQDIMVLTDASPGAAGFIDRDMHAGTNWPRTLSEALATCRVFVPLYSPRYFKSEYCGREWYAFHRRLLEHKAKNGELADTIIPALWVAVDPENLPGIASAIQFDHRAFGTRYSRDGFYGIMKLGRYRTEYKQAVYQLARRIVQVANSTSIDPLPFDDFESLPSPFGSVDNEMNGQRLNITIAAPDEQTLPSGRRSCYYGPTARDWRPFHPDYRQPLAEYADDLAKCLGFEPVINTLAEDLSDFGSSASNGAPGLLLLDAWSSLSSADQEKLRRFDQRSQPWISVMVPLNSKDEDTMTIKTELQESLNNSVRQLFERVPYKYRKASSGIPNLREFGDMFPALAHYVANKFLKKAEAHPPSGPAVDRFKLLGPVSDDGQDQDDRPVKGDRPDKDNGDSR